ncbi:hypothetical protein P7C73_g1327, partial [Tremellales sp. Uapishka_1]
MNSMFTRLHIRKSAPPSSDLPDHSSAPDVTVTLPLDILSVVARHLHATQSLRTIANLQGCSTGLYDVITPILYKTIILASDDSSLCKPFSFDSDTLEGAPPKVDESLYKAQHLSKPLVHRRLAALCFTEKIIVKGIDSVDVFGKLARFNTEASSSYVTAFPRASSLVYNFTMSILHSEIIWKSPLGRSNTFAPQISSVCIVLPFRSSSTLTQRIGFTTHPVNSLDLAKTMSALVFIFPHLRTLTVHGITTERQLPQTLGIRNIYHFSSSAMPGKVTRSSQINTTILNPVFLRACFEVQELEEAKKTTWEFVNANLGGEEMENVGKAFGSLEDDSNGLYRLKERIKWDEQPSAVCENCTVAWGL